MSNRLEHLLSRIDWEQMAISGLRIFVVVLLLWLLLRFADLLLSRLEQRLLRSADDAAVVTGEGEKRAETIVRLLRQGVMILLWVTGILIVLREVGVEIAPLLASAGVAGLAVGFGAQNLVRDFIAGFFVILENQVRVGDVAIVNGTGGLVEAVNFRTIVLRDLAGTVHVFPNGAVTTLSNMTREWSGYVFNIGVAYKEDVDEVIALMKEVGAELRQDAAFGPLIIEEIEIFGVDDFADSSIVIKGRLKTLPIKQWEVGREYRRRLKHAFDAHGIEIPFPQRTYHVAPSEQALFAALMNKGGD